MARCRPVIEAECQGQDSFHSHVTVEIISPGSFLQDEAQFWVPNAGGTHREPWKRHRGDQEI